MDGRKEKDYDGAAAGAASTADRAVVIKWPAVSPAGVIEAALWPGKFRTRSFAVWTDCEKASVARRRRPSPPKQRANPPSGRARPPRRTSPMHKRTLHLRQSRRRKKSPISPGTVIASAGDSAAHRRGPLAV